MKKRIFMLALMVALIVCALTVVASADTIVPSDSNEYGALTTFDTAIGRTDISPEKEDGTIARTVLFDGTNYYTIPTVYILTKNAYEASNVKLFQYDLSAVNSKMGKSFSKNSIIRCELPDDITRLGGNNQNFNGCSKLLEVKLPTGIRFVGDSTYKAFANCSSITEIDISMMEIEYPKCTYSLFEYCEKLVTVKLPDAYVDANGTAVNYETDFMFNGCKALTTIENLYGLMSGTNRMNQKMFKDCIVLSNIEIWDGVTSISAEALRATAITSVVIPEGVTTLPNHVFADCKSLQKVVFSSGLTSVGNYCFEKCTALTDIWFPSVSVSFAQQVFGQVGASKNINLYFPTSSVTVTFSSDSYNNDPVMNAIYKSEGTDRIKLNTPLSTKCSVFIGDHTKPANIISCLDGGVCTVCSTAFAPYATEHTKDTATLTFPNGLTANGIYTYDCTNPGCTIVDILEGDEQGRDVVAPLFTAKGYSLSPDKMAVNGGYTINHDTLTLYNDVKKTNLVYGIVIANAEKFDGKSFFNADKKVNTTKALQVEINNEYSNFDCSINFGATSNSDLKLIICAYVIDGDNVTFIQAESGEAVDSSLVTGGSFKSVTLDYVAALPTSKEEEIA